MYFFQVNRPHLVRNETRDCVQRISYFAQAFPRFPVMLPSSCPPFREFWKALPVTVMATFYTKHSKHCGSQYRNHYRLFERGTSYHKTLGGCRTSENGTIPNGRDEHKLSCKQCSITNHFIKACPERVINSEPF